MMKKMISLVLLCALMFTLAAGSALAEGQPAAVATATDESDLSDRYFDDPVSGIKFRWPDAWYAALYEQPCIAPSGTEHSIMLDFIAQTALDAMNKLYTGPALPEDPAQFTPEQQALADAIDKGTLPLVAIAVEKDGARDAATRDRYSDEKRLGEANGTVYTLLTNPGTDLSALTDEEKARYQALLSAAPEFEKELEVTGQKDMFEEANVTFDSTTLDGEAIDTSIFKDHKLTMINIWATWCGPCVGELPELQKLYENLPEGTNLIGICTDGLQESELAKRMQDESGVKYKSIVANEAMEKGFLSNIQALPTTIFVDSEGNMVGEPFVGVPSGEVVETYRAAIEERLALLK